MSRPWLYVSPFFDRHKDEYIDALFAVSSEGAWSRWLELCLRATIDVSKDGVRRARELLRIRTEYHQQADRGSGRMHALIEGLFSNPILRISDTARRLDVSYPTAKSDIEKLVELRLLEELHATYPKAFVARPIFNAAYREDF